MVGTRLTVPTYYVYDGHGSVRALMGEPDSNGDVQFSDTYSYDAFGITISEAHPLEGATPNDYLYAGESYIGDLGLYYNRARYLSVTTGRFRTMDKHEGSAYNPISLRKYLYCAADPVNNTDPSGLFSGTLL